MTLRELLKELSLGELSNLAAGIEGYGEIRGDKIPNVVSMINEALLRLYSKFIFINITHSFKLNKTIFVELAVRLAVRYRYKILSQYIGNNRVVNV